MGVNNIIIYKIKIIILIFINFYKYRLKQYFYWNILYYKTLSMDFLFVATIYLRVYLLFIFQNDFVMKNKLPVIYFFITNSTQKIMLPYIYKQLTTINYIPERRMIFWHIYLLENWLITSSDSESCVSWNIRYKIGHTKSSCYEWNSCNLKCLKNFN